MASFGDIMLFNLVVTFVLFGETYKHTVFENLSKDECVFRANHINKNDDSIQAKCEESVMWILY